ncbi:STAS domain-containing protein [Magnetospirillum sp. UT-4]|uniref:STAS domain-containing protein n=1 Tax=Magnetospirillum sp. UT-4 TaxID=2681467 RepID=UPI0013843964|nr:STAS domain-containing protein [Magnetospirillum sp. UT-4]CAA7619696.1 Anti-sigma factor antagonist [Magnetospirillum sp. UT-4]
MTHRMSEDGATLTVAFTGQINFSANIEFRDLLAEIVEKRPQRVVFDLSDLAAVDSVGLGLLYIANEEVAAMGAKLILAHPRDRVARLLELTESAQIFEILH